MPVFLKASTLCFDSGALSCPDGVMERLPCVAAPGLRPGPLPLSRGLSRPLQPRPLLRPSRSLRPYAPRGAAARAGQHEQLGPLIFIVYFLHLLGFTMGGPLLPALRNFFHLAASKTGMITSAFPLGMLLALPIFPALSDRYGRKPILIVCFAGVGGGFLLQALALASHCTFSRFLQLRVLSGAFAGSATVIKALIADSYKGEDLAQAMAYREAAGTAAFIAGPTLGGILLSLGGISAVAAASGSLSLIAALLVVFYLHPPPKVSKGSSPSSTKLSSNLRVLSLIIVAHCLFCSGQAAFDAFFAVWCSESFGWSPALVGSVLTSLACLVFASHAFVYRRLVRKFGVVRMAVAGLLSLAGALLAMSRPRLLLAVLALYGFGVPAFTPSVPTLLARNSSQRATVLAVDAAASAVARILAPAVLGLVYDKNPQSAFFAAAVCLVMAAGLMSSLSAEKK
ncbi:unnamed protein product [Effrenium voratum]|nr:unnamed protein product [Effrenium voratum]